MMASLSFMTLLASALTAQAKLSGWPHDFAVVEVANLGTDSFSAVICKGWGTWCDKSQCTPLESFDHTPRDASWAWASTWKWYNLRKPQSAWVDIWHINGDTFNMYEQNGDGSVQGQCQVAQEYTHSERCGVLDMRPLLHCWQW